MSDRRYLKLRGGRWYFQIAVPKELQERYGSKTIIQALGTGDLREAQRLRHERIATAQAIFYRLRNDETLTPDEIERYAAQDFVERLEFSAKIRAKGGASFLAHSEPDINGAPVDPEVAGLELVLGEVGDAIQQNDFSLVRSHAEAIIAESGGAMSRDSKAYQDLCHALLRSRYEAYSAQLALKRGEIFSPTRPFNPSVIDPVTLEPKVPLRRPGRERMRDGASISEVAKRYFADMMRDSRAKWGEQTKTHYETSIRLFSDFMDDAPLATVTRQDASEFLEAISRLRRDWGRSPDSKGLSLAKLLDRYSGAPSISNTTLNRHITALHGLYKWARKQGLFEGDNPFAEQTRARGRQSATGYLPHTVEELNILFGAPLFRETPRGERIAPDKYGMKSVYLWAPLIALFSGMRSGELCQLRVADVSEEGGIWFFNVRPGEGQSVKTETSIRRVPVHSELVQCGFLDYLEGVSQHASKQLFPALKPGGRDRKYNWYFTKRWTDFRRRLGLTRDRLGFHSFRKNVGTALERARVPENEAVQILGHEKLSMSYSVYSLGLDLKGLQDVVEKITYPGLDLSHLH